MLLYMKRETAFKIINANRQDRARAEFNFKVVSLNKDGSPSKSRFTDTDWQFNAFKDEATAEKRARQLETLNPGKKFTVIPA